MVHPVTQLLSCLKERDKLFAGVDAVTIAWVAADVSVIPFLRRRGTHAPTASVTLAPTATQFAPFSLNTSFAGR
jgi:hypothetical protein